MSTGDPTRLVGRRTELAQLDRLIALAGAGQSQVLVLRGEAGIGKSALLDHLGNVRGWTIARAIGVESEMEFAYGGLHQLCAPFLDRLERLPVPQREALTTAFGLGAGDAPDRFMVGLAVLVLLADQAEDRPVLCLVDDAQWLDRVSAQTVAFVARRLLAERIALVIAIREPAPGIEFDGLPALQVDGLSAVDAGALLDSVIKGPIDGRVRDRIIAETDGNPLALLELPHAWTTAELADGLPAASTDQLASRIEQGYQRRLQALPVATRRLLLAAAAEPVGDPAILWRAAEGLGLGSDHAVPADEAGLIEFRGRVRFRHPLVRAAAYRSASIGERQEVHRALAEATDADTDPDRRAWHRAQTTTAPDEEIAAELERSAGRARARGGLVAASALLDRATWLTPDPRRRAERGIAAAWAKRDAGALDDALALLAAVEAGPADAIRSAEAEHLRGQIAFDQRRGVHAARLLLASARRLETLDLDRAREMYRDALAAALWASGPGAADVVDEVARAARSAPAARTPPRAIDLALDALAVRLTDGYVTAAPFLTRALAAIEDEDGRGEDVGSLLGIGGSRAGVVIATEVWALGPARAFSERQVSLARTSGALLQLQFALNNLAIAEMLAGDLASARTLIEEDRLVGEVTGSWPMAYSEMLLAAFRGDEQGQASLIALATDGAISSGEGRIASFADYATAVLQNGLGRHDLARNAAHRAVQRDVVGGYQVISVAELAEAASRTGEDEVLADAVARLSERADATPGDFVLGMRARAEALQGGERDVDARYRDSLDHLDGTGQRVEVARGHLLYGEWLRREGRRVDARAQLRTAHDQFVSMGLAGFAERARRELQATGEKVRKRTLESANDLTPQEIQIARLVRSGLSNVEIGTRLFLSPRTVEWHLRKVFTKLDLSSRRELRDAPLDGMAA